MMIVDLIAWSIFGVICFICLFFLIKQRGLHPELFELLEGEDIVKMIKGDYWCYFANNEVQNMGEFAFTNKRILFKGTFWLSQDKYISIPYEEIKSIKKTVVGYIWPTAFIVTTSDDEEYKFSIMKRQIYIDLINSYTKTDKE